MSIYQTSKADLVAYASSVAGVTIPEAQVTLSNVRPTTPEEKLKYNRNTRCVITFIDGSTVASGMNALWYDRLDLAIIAKMVLVPRRADPGNAIADLVNDIRAMTGIMFNLAELESTVVVAGANGNNTLKLQAKASSLGWIGSVDIPFLDLPNITTAFKADTLNLF